MRLAVIHPRHSDWAPALQEAEPRLEVRGWHPEALASADWAWLRQAEGLFCWKLPAGLVPRMPALAWIQNSGAGVDHLLAHPDLPPGIPVTRADGAFGFWMARYAAGHLLAEAQRLGACAAAQAEARWDGRLLPEDLTGQTALVLGFGRIGRQIGRTLRELGLTVTGLVRQPRPDPEFPLVGLEALASRLFEARALVLAAPLTAETRGLMDAGRFALGSSRLTLINVGRGELVDLPALLAALDRGSLGRAVLDVFPEEPLPRDSPLWHHPKVTITPHHSGPSTPRQMIPDLLPNLRAFAEGRPISGSVDRTLGY